MNDQTFQPRAATFGHAANPPQGQGYVLSV